MRGGSDWDQVETVEAGGVLDFEGGVTDNPAFRLETQENKASRYLLVFSLRNRPSETSLVGRARHFPDILSGSERAVD